MKRKKRIVLLGVSGSIGRQALDIIDAADDVEVVGAAVNESIDFLESEINKRAIPFAAVGSGEGANALASRGIRSCKLYNGIEGMCDMIRECAPDIVLNALGGMVGLIPTLTAIREGCDIALANKETLVAGGRLVMDEARASGAKILPVDSEHSAIWQSLRSGNYNEVSKLILTASGGPFFNLTKEELKDVTLKEALHHPNWNMGRKITIDSATMMNKGLEIIEAMHLFSMDESKIDVVIHPQSVIHSAVEFNDGAIIAQLGAPDMRLPIAYALNEERRAKIPVKRLSLTDVSELTFFNPDEDKFPCLRLARESAKKLGTATVVLNGANEAAVELFLNGAIGFTDIAWLVERALDMHTYKKRPSLDEIISSDKGARRFVYESAKSIKR